MDQLKTLRDELVRRRGQVVVWAASHGHGEDAAQAVRDLLADPPALLQSPSYADRAFEDRGESTDGGLAHLDRIDAGTARRLLVHVLRFDLAYGAEIMDAATAAQLADRVLGTLREPARWWTNGTIGLPGERDSLSWTGLTEATFDTGVIGASPDQVLVVWFMDED